MVNWIVVGELELPAPRLTVRRIRARRVHRRRKATASMLSRRTSVLLRKLRRSRSSTGIRAELEANSRRAVRLAHRHLHPEPV